MPTINGKSDPHLEVIDKAVEQLMDHLEPLGILGVAILTTSGSEHSPKTALSTNGFEVFDDIEHALCAGITINREAWRKENEC